MGKKGKKKGKGSKQKPKQVVDPLYAFTAKPQKKKRKKKSSSRWKIIFPLMFLPGGFYLFQKLFLYF